MSPPAAILVPTEQHLWVELGTRSDAVRTLRSFVEDAACRLAPDVTFASPHETRLLTSQALDGVHHGGLRFPEEPAARAGLAHAIDRTVGRLRRAGTTAGHLRAVGYGYALVVADILDRVDGELAALGRTDGRARTSVVARRLAEGCTAETELVEITRGGVTVTGLAAFDPDEVTLLESLHARLHDVGCAGLRLELPRFTGAIARAPDDAIVPIADEIERRWGSLLDPPEIEWRATRTGLPVAVIAARTADGEARAVATHIVAALARGTPPERIAVVVPDLDETRMEPLRAALGDARVPFCEPRGRPVSTSPEARTALTLLALAEGPVTRDRVIELLRAPGVSASLWAERVAGRNDVDRGSLLAHRLRDVPVEIDRTGKLLVDGLAQAIEERPDEAWMPIALDRLLQDLRGLGDTAPELNAFPRSEIARRLVALLDRLCIGRPDPHDLGTAIRSETRGGGALLARALGQGAAAVRAIREATRALGAAAETIGVGDRPISPGGFAAELTLAIAELGLGLGAAKSAAGASAVRIARASDVAGLEHDLVLVTGLDEGAYGGADVESSLLDERILKRLPNQCRPPLAREREAARHAELAWAMAGSDRVVLSHAGGDTGDLASPHRLIRWGLEHVGRELREPASRVAPTASRPDVRSAELATLAAGGAPRGDLADRVNIERSRTAFFLNPRAPSDAFNGRIVLADDGERQRLVMLVGGDVAERSIAVTVIERAAGCAFAGFARRVLRVRRIDDLGESADSRERGTLVHRALEAAFECMREERTTDRARLLTAARGAAEQRLGISASMAPLRREAVVQAVEDAVRVVARALDSADPVRFVLAERAFGAREKAPWGALELTGDDGPAVYVEGRIDRIDASADGRRARVVDYKTGRAPPTDDHGKSAFQLPLYAQVVSRALSTTDVEALYIGVRPRGVVEEQPKAPEERQKLGALRDEVGHAARRVILGLWQGEVGPRPATAMLCGHCEARDVCRRPAVAPIEDVEDG